MATATKRRPLHAVAAGASLRPLAEQAYECIKRDILMCAIGPGAEVSEAQLAARYGLGKAPVRAALARLSHERLVKSAPRRGYTVSPVTLRDIEDVFELRLLLEPATARLAAGRSTPAGSKRWTTSAAPATRRTTRRAVCAFSTPTVSSMPQSLWRPAISDSPPR